MGRVRHNPKSEKFLEESKYVFDENTIKEILEFKNNLIYLEVGHGKGDFLIENSYKNPDIFYIGIEKYKTIQHIAVEKLQNRIQNTKIDNNNLIFVSTDVNNLENIFKANSLDKIYINFPDPWPKERHKKRRLVDRGFLEKYYKVLKKQGQIEFRTDQKDLYYYLLLELEEISKDKNFDIRLKLIEKTTNLHKKHNIDIKTEYEKKFINLGNKIYFIKLESY